MGAASLGNNFLVPLFELFRRRVIAVLVSALTLGTLHARPVSDTATTCDELCTRVRSELTSFTSWLTANNAQGYIGEVGWPSTDARWNALAERWYRDADSAGLWVTAWATGEWWGTTYPLSVYVDAVPPAGIESPRPQAQVIGIHPTSGPVWRGVNVAGGEFGAPNVDATSTFSNERPGTVDQTYHYDNDATFRFVAAQGVKVVRIPFRWERVQPRLGAELDVAEVRRIKDVVARAGAAGLKVVLDLHNYGGYYVYDALRNVGVRRSVGSAEVTVANFADVWRRLSVYFKGNPGVLGYGLMNEPVAMPGGARTWELASQAAVDRIRGNGDGSTLLVGGYNWSGAQSFATNHPKKWIVDYSHRTLYEAHHYWDRDNSGDYPDSYDAEVQNARSRGYRPSA